MKDPVSEIVKESQIRSTNEGVLTDYAAQAGQGPTQARRFLVNRKYHATIEQNKDGKWSVAQLAPNESGDIEFNRWNSLTAIGNPKYREDIKKSGTITEDPVGQSEVYRIRVEFDDPGILIGFSGGEFVVRRSLGWMPEKIVFHFTPGNPNSGPFVAYERTIEYAEYDGKMCPIRSRGIAYSADKSQSQETLNEEITYLDPTSNDPKEVYLSFYGLEEPVFVPSRRWPMALILFLAGVAVVAAVGLGTYLYRRRKPVTT